MLLSIDGTLIVQLVNFLIFLVVLNAIFLKPVGTAIAKRRAYIDGVTSDIRQFERDINALRAQAEEKRAAARREADAALAAARAAAQNEAAELTATYVQQAGDIVAAAHAQVATEIAAARRDSDRIVNALADDLLARALGTAA